MDDNIIRIIKVHPNINGIWIQSGYPLIHPIFGTQGLQCDLPRALRPGHSDLFQRSKQGFRSCAGKKGGKRNKTETLLFDCFCVFSMLMSTQNRKQNRKLVASATFVLFLLLRWVTMWWQVIDPSSDFWSHWPQDRYGSMGSRGCDADNIRPNAKVEVGRNQNDKNVLVSLKFSYDMIF